MLHQASQPSQAISSKLHRLAIYQKQVEDILAMHVRRFAELDRRAIVTRLRDGRMAIGGGPAVVGQTA